jgi:hypothetical protein
MKMFLRFSIAVIICILLIACARQSEFGVGGTGGTGDIPPGGGNSKYFETPTPTPFP